jgi:hypothetical protein
VFTPDWTGPSQFVPLKVSITKAELVAARAAMSAVVEVMVNCIVAVVVWFEEEVRGRGGVGLKWKADDLFCFLVNIREGGCGQYLYAIFQQ